MKRGYTALLAFLLAWTLLIGLILGWLLADMGLQVRNGISKLVIETEDRKQFIPTLATPGGAIVPTKTPLMTATPSAISENGPAFPFLTLPFSDTFDGWIRPEWTVIKGMPVVIDGRLCNSHLWTTLGLMYRLPDSFIIGFDYYFSVTWPTHDYILLQIGDNFAINIDYRDLKFRLYDGENWATVGTKKLRRREGKIDIVINKDRVQVYLSKEPLSNLSYPFGDVSYTKLTIRGRDASEAFCIDNFYINKNSNY